jgi:hypothetical protein
MAATDNNVRAGRRVPATTALGARRFVLARLLLFVLRLAQLDRKLLLLLAALPMSACIIPFGPEFQDPDGRANSAPEIISTNPVEGLIVTTRKFEVTVSDADADDTLYFRLIADYPDLPGALTHHIVQEAESPPGPAGQPHVAHFGREVDCIIHNLDPSLVGHRIMAIVADREFIADSPNLMAIEKGGRLETVLWFWNVTCPGPLPPASQ